MKAKQRVPVPRARAARHFGCQGLGCDRFWLRRRVNETENHAQQSGIWGMSVQDDAFDPEGTGHFVKGGAEADLVVAEQQGRSRLRQQTGEPLLALEKGPRDEILAVEVE